MQISPIILFLLGELLLVSTVVSVVLIAVSVARKRGDRAAARKLVSRLKKDEARRKEETGKIIEERFGLKDEKLEEHLSRISREEKRFYQSMINLYLKRDAAALGNLNVTFEGATEPYRSIELPVTAVSGASDSAVRGDEEELKESDEAEIERLIDENRQLSEELKTTMETMGRMLKEYSTMYGGEKNPPDPKQVAALMMVDDGGDMEAEALISEHDEHLTVESSETSVEEESLAAIEEPAGDPVPDDIDSLIDDVALQRDNAAEVVENSSDNQKQTLEEIDPDPVDDQGDDWDDLEVMPEDDALLDLGSDEAKE